MIFTTCDMIMENDDSRRWECHRNDVMRQRITYGGGNSNSPCDIHFTPQDERNLIFVANI